MSNLSKTVADGFVSRYRNFAKRVESLADTLSEEQFWHKPYPYGNSFGNLVLHVTGNLSYYIGARIAETGYVRERDREFTDRRPGEKAEVVRALAAAVDVVVAALEAETDETWSAEYSAVGIEDAANRFEIYLSCAAHFQHHIGQMLYIVKELLEAERTSGDAN